jgi:hypothetical protein
MNANMSMSGSCGFVSFATGMIGRADISNLSDSRLPWGGAATDGVARKIMATAEACRQRRIIKLG